MHEIAWTLGRLVALHEMRRTPNSSGTAPALVWMLGGVIIAGLVGAIVLNPALSLLTLLGILGLAIQLTVGRQATRSTEPTVTRAGAFYLKFDCVPLRPGRVAVHPRQWPSEKKPFHFPSIGDPERLAGLVAQVGADLNAIPELLRSDIRGEYEWVFPDDTCPIREKVDLFDHEATLATHLGELLRELNQQRFATTLLSLLDSEEPLAQFVVRHGTPLRPDGPPQSGGIEHILGSADALNPTTLDLRDAELRQVPGRLHDMLAVIGELRRSSCEEILRPGCRDILSSAQYAAFSFLCPRCNDGYLRDLRERPVIDVSDTRQRPFLNTAASVQWLPSKSLWRCSLCERDSAVPLSIPRLFSEVFRPAFDRLMTEHHAERVGVYNEIVDQKRRYQTDGERDRDLKHENHRREIASLRRSLAERSAEFDAARQKSDFYAAQLIAMEVLKRDRVQRITAIADDLSQKTEQSLREFNSRFSRRLRDIEDEAAASMTQHAALARVEDARRDAFLAQIATSVQEVAENTREIAAVEKTFAEAAGHNSVAIWNPRWISRTTRDAANKIVGGSDVDRFRGPGVN